MYVIPLTVLFCISALANGFQSLSQRSPKINSHPLCASTCFQHPDSSDRFYKKKHLFDRSLPEDPLYIVIWKDCQDCQELLQNMKEQKVNHFYLNMDECEFYSIDSSQLDGEDAADYYDTIENEQSAQKVWKDIHNHTGEIPIPLFYKNEEFIGNTLMDIYAEIFPM